MRSVTFKLLVAALSLSVLSACGSQHVAVHPVAAATWSPEPDLPIFSSPQFPTRLHPIASDGPALPTDSSPGMSAPRGSDSGRPPAVQQWSVPDAGPTTQTRGAAPAPAPASAGGRVAPSPVSHPGRSSASPESMNHYQSTAAYYFDYGQGHGGPAPKSCDGWEFILKVHDQEDNATRRGTLSSPSLSFPNGQDRTTHGVTNFRCEWVISFDVPWGQDYELITEYPNHTPYPVTPAHDVWVSLGHQRSSSARPCGDCHIPVGVRLVGREANGTAISF
jgi:hypothetical protein